MLILLFVLGAVAMRFLPHAWNFTPVIAMLLLAACYMKPKHLWMPVVALVGSDFALNAWVYHTPGRPDQYFTWASYFVVLGLAMWALKGRVRVAALIGTSLASSTLFFVISNFGVWVTGEMYPHTFSGLATCYALGVPFFRNAAVGDLIYAGAFFALYAWLEQRHQASLRAAA
ncbi:MAG TPA: DUF6580 family putative transport protein [Terriglobales bacterium]|nr:DUF6580 family putative transport protein [Terriglobales bacterium]